MWALLFFRCWSLSFFCFCFWLSFRIIRTSQGRGWKWTLRGHLGAFSYSKRKAFYMTGGSQLCMTFWSSFREPLDPWLRFSLLWREPHHGSLQANCKSNAVCHVLTFPFQNSSIWGVVHVTNLVWFGMRWTVGMLPILTKTIEHSKGNIPRVLVIPGYKCTQAWSSAALAG